MLPQDQAPSAVPSFRADLARSRRLFSVFLKEQSDPDAFYGALAQDSVAMVAQWVDLPGSLIVDIGGGPGYFAAAFEAAGARYAGLEPDAGELVAHGAPGGIAVRGSGLALPLADGGLVVLSRTPWLSPHGGHETGMWHYVGGRFAADRYAARMGRRPKNDFGTSLFNCPVGPMVRWARRTAADGRTQVVDVFPRYHPQWAHWVADVPGVREVLSWNAVIVLRVAGS